ncbi:MAG: hypothetical protein JWR26_2417 [Pedosphaera sp.]|nr:hypothetical protein [Pedosphaera sp.]
MIEENDLVLKTDRHYTQGLKFSYLAPDNQLPCFASCLAADIPLFGFATNVSKFGFEIGQNIYTPANLAAKQLLSDDRPYSGWLYTALVLQRRGLTDLQMPVLEEFQLDLGVIGPWSLADQAQTIVHQLRGFALPQGWHNQLKNEPGVAVKYERSWRVSTSDRFPFGMDFLPRIGASLGNVDTSGRIGTTLRVGWHLLDDFGVQTIDSYTTPEGGWEYPARTGRWGFYGFVGVQGRAVGYATSLDGNLFRGGPSVEKRPFVGQLETGGVLVLRRVEMGVTLVFRTPEFTRQSEHDGFGSVFLRAKF